MTRAKTADFFHYRTLDDCPTWDDFVVSLNAAWAGREMALGRYTRVDAEHPQPGYPDGWYAEGWRKQPAKQGPFKFPLEETEGAAE